MGELPILLTGRTAPPAVFADVGIPGRYPMALFAFSIFKVHVLITFFPRPRHRRLQSYSDQEHAFAVGGDQRGNYFFSIFAFLAPYLTTRS